MNKNRLIFPQFKSYGDLVIACYALRKYGCGQELLLCGSHLIDLVKILGFECYEVIDCDDVLAYFNLRRRGLLEGAKSLFKIRGELKKRINSGDRLIIDKLGLKECVLYSGFDILPIGPRQNIYYDYKNYLGVAAGVGEINCCFEPGRFVGIFPDSRVWRKTIPEELYLKLWKNLTDFGYQCRVVRIGSGQDTEIVKYINGFESLAATIKSFDSIISSDSLPAHLAQMYSIPMFVMSPTDNSYWLPEYSLEKNSNCLFGDWEFKTDLFYKQKR